MAKVATLTDTFATQDTTKWTGWGADVYLSSGRLGLNVNPAYPRLSASGLWDLTSSSIMYELVQPPNVGAGSTQVFADLTLDANNKIQFLWENSTVIARIITAGTASDGTPVAYNATSHRWWRISESGGTITWATSPDAQTWTTRRTLAATFTLTSLAVAFYAGYWGTETAPGVALLDNVNIRTGQVGVPAPAFFDPTTSPAQWDALLANHSGVPFIIVNPATGPGTSANANYTTRITQVQAAGIKVIGYVNTNYGGIAAATVDADIDTWHTLYPSIDGIYFALTDGATATVPYYQARATKARSYGASQMVVTNPGWWPTDEAHIVLADVVMVFENNYSTLLSTPEAWYPAYTLSGTYPVTRFWWAFSSVPTMTEAQEVLRRARAWKIGYVYVTDGTTYNVLPTYWSAFLSAAASPPASPTGAAGLTGAGVLAGTATRVTTSATAGLSGSGALAAGNSNKVTPGTFTGTGTLAATSVRGGQITAPLPAYFDATTLPEQWNALFANHAGVPWIVVDPATGAGTSVNANYAARIAQAQAAGIKVIGYVNTQYGGIAPATVDADIDAWHTLYPSIDGIFFDLTDGATATVPYFQARAAKVRSYGSSQMLVTNPGWWPTDEAHIAMADVVLVFENNYSTLLSTPETWYPTYTMSGAYPTTRFWWVFYDVPTMTEAQEVLRRALAWKIGYVYVTDDPTPYDALPTYWPDFLAALGAPSSAVTGTTGLHLRGGSSVTLRTGDTLRGGSPTAPAVPGVVSAAFSGVGALAAARSGTSGLPASRIYRVVSGAWTPAIITRL